MERVGAGEHFRFALEVDLGVDVGCIDGDSPMIDTSPGWFDLFVTTPAG